MRIILGLAAMACGLSSAVAEERFSWTGAYIGLQGGYIDYNAKQGTAIDKAPYGTSDVSDTGYTVGALGGYNHQFANGIVVGAEADLSYAGPSAIRQRLYNRSGALLPMTSMSHEAELTGSLRARLGYGIGRFMPYVTGGLAIARYEAEFDYTIGNAVFHRNDTATGYAVGGGLDFALTDNIILKAEYRYADFGTVFTPEVGATEGFMDLKTSDVKFAVSYKF